MNPWVGAIGALALMAASPAMSQSVQDAAVQAFTQICIPASETSTAPRDLAAAAGYQQGGRLEPGLRGMFPTAGLSFIAPSDEGRVQVVSTVMPPPSTPYSCLVTVEGDANGVFAGVTAYLTAQGYAPNDAANQSGVEMLDMQKTDGAAIDRVIGLRNLNPQGDGDMLLIAYRVE